MNTSKTERRDRPLQIREISFFIISFSLFFHGYRLLLLPKSGSLGENDRSRWLTVRALVDEGTYSIGKRGKNETGKGYKDSGIMMERYWSTVDKVLDPSSNLFYSSKPPFLSTIVAAEYWVLKNYFGLSIVHEPKIAIGIILCTINLLPMLIYLLLMRGFFCRFAKNDWTQLFLLCAAAFGTFIPSFLTTLNNHTMGAFALTSGLYFFFKIWIDKKTLPMHFASCGFFFSLLICFELPAIALSLAIFLALWLISPGQTIRYFTTGMVLPLIFFLATNYLAVGTLIPVYEKFGSEWYSYAGSWWSHPRGIDAGGDSLPLYTFHTLFGHHGFFSLTPIFFLSLWSMRETLIIVKNHRSHMKKMTIMTIIISLVIFLFYALKTNNYGGGNVGLRWFFWLIPLWLLVSIPGIDQLYEKKGMKMLCLVLLYFSIFSAFYHFINPWGHPWLYEVF